MSSFIRFFIFFVFIFLTLEALAEERIHNYHSIIDLYENRDMHVTEIIDVKSEGKKIKRGI